MTDRSMELHLKPDALQRYALPDIAYPIPPEALSAALEGDGELPFAQMLFALQERSATAGADWRGMEPALTRLAELIAPDDDRTEVTAAGEEWWIELGAVDIGGPIVTIQREQELIAALAKRSDGTLRLATYRPLDAKSARLVIGLSHRPHPEGGVCMRENNWEYALDASAGAGQYYAFVSGEAHLSYWSQGIGLVDEGTIDTHWRDMLGCKPRPLPQVAIELGIAYAYSDAL